MRTLESLPLPIKPETSGNAHELTSHDNKRRKASRLTSERTATFRYLRNITVPAAFVTKSTGDILKGLVKLGSEPAYIVMDWTDVLPGPTKWNGSSGLGERLFSVCTSQQT